MDDLRIEWPETVIVLADVRLPRPVVFPQAHAVIRHEDHNRIAPEIEVVDLGKNAPHPAIDQLRLRAVVCPQISKLGLCVIAGFAVVRMKHGRTLVIRIIAAYHVLRRVPGFVRVKEIHPQEEGAVLIVFLQPLDRQFSRARRETVDLPVPAPVNPCVEVDQVAPLKMVADVARLVVGHHLVDRMVHTQEVSVAFLAGQRVRAAESLEESSAHQVGTVTQQLADVTGLTKDLR